MNKLNWQLHYGFTDEDMAHIELALTYGVKITTIFDKPLGYEDIKINC